MTKQTNDESDKQFVDVTALAAERGFAIPVRMSSEFWKQQVLAVTASGDRESQVRTFIEFTGIFLGTARVSGSLDFAYQVFSVFGDSSHIWLKCVCSLGEDQQPLLTIMLPEETCVSPPRDLEAQNKCLAALRREQIREEGQREQAWQNRLDRLRQATPASTPPREFPSLRERGEQMANKLKAVKEEVESSGQTQSPHSVQNTIRHRRTN